MSINDSLKPFLDGLVNWDELEIYVGTILQKKDHCTDFLILFFLFYRLLHSDRDAIPEVPAIYFVLPTEENVKRICQVGVFYINFGIHAWDKDCV